MDAQTLFRPRAPAIDQPMLATKAFTSMVVSGPVAQIISGQKLARNAIEMRSRFALRLFLSGTRPR